MKNILKYLILIYLLILAIVSQNIAQVDMYGYFESEGDYMMFEKDDFYFGYNKFRLDLLGISGEKVEVGTDIIYKNFNGKTTWNLMNFIPEKYCPISEYPYIMSDTLFLDNAYLQLEMNNFRIILGRQQISSGVGYAWNPTDIFNMKDIMDPTYEQTGVDAITVEIPVGLGGNFTGILQPKNNWDRTTKYIKYKHNIGQFDVSLSYGQKRKIFNYVNFIDSLSYDFSQEMYGANIVGELLGIGVWTEFGIYDHDLKDLMYTSTWREPNAIQENKFYYEYVIGMDYTFENSLYLMGEYFHTDFGVEKNANNFNHYMDYFQSNIHGLNKNYVFTNVMYPINGLITIGMFNIANLDDKSVVFNPQIKYLLSNNVEINFIGSIFYGDEDLEFGLQNYNFRLRLKAYF
jgi:hypothetical protein